MPQDIKDIKMPIDIPSQWTWVWIVLAVLVLVALITGLIFLLKKQKPQEEKQPEIPVFLPWERAYARLESLKSKNLIDRPSLKQFYIELSDIIRRYLEDRFQLKAPEMTTEEFLDSLKSSNVLKSPQKELLKEFLYACDMVKFAKHESNKEEALKSFDIVKQLIDQTRGN